MGAEKWVRECSTEGVFKQHLAYYPPSSLTTSSAQFHLLTNQNLLKHFKMVSKNNQNLLK